MDPALAVLDEVWTQSGSTKDIPVMEATQQDMGMHIATSCCRGAQPRLERRHRCRAFQEGWGWPGCPGMMVSISPLDTHPCSSSGSTCSALA